MGVSLLVMLAVVLCIAAVVAAFAASGRRAEPGPHSGHCGYNLTGATTNRCPECGKLFIEAGVVIGRQDPTPRRSRLVIAAVILPLGLMTCWVIVSLIQGQRVAAARARAVAAQQAAQAAAQQPARAVVPDGPDPVEPAEMTQ